jgi:hypothetical protein
MQENTDINVNNGCCKCKIGTDIHAKVMSLSLNKLGSYFVMPPSATSAYSASEPQSQPELQINHNGEVIVTDEPPFNGYIQPSTFSCVKCHTEICYECILKQLLQHPNIPNSVGYRCPACTYFNCNTIAQVPNENLNSKYYVPKLEIHHIIGKSYISTNTTTSPNPLLPFHFALKPQQTLDEIALDMPHWQSSLHGRILECRKYQQSTKRKRYAKDQEDDEYEEDQYEEDQYEEEDQLDAEEGMEEEDIEEYNDDYKNVY